MLHFPKSVIRLTPLAVILLLTACGGAASQVARIASGAAGTPAPQDSSAGKAPAQTGKPTPLANCQAIEQANLRFGLAMPQLINLTANSDYDALTRSDSPFLVDMAKERADLDTLATLPDPAGAVDQVFGKPSDSVAYFRQLLTVAEANIKSRGKPFNDTDSSGQKVIGLDSPWMQKVGSFGLAIDKACPGVTLQMDTPVAPTTYNGTKYSVGQTANDGDLRITLDKVATVAGDPGNLPDDGNRFVVFYVTIENTGKTPLSLPVAAYPVVNDAAGTPHYFDPHTIMLSAAKISDLIGIDIPAGGKLSGAIGYQLPSNAGNLTWSILETGKTPVIFNVQTGEIAVVGTPIDPATADAMRLNEAATVTAIVGMADNADATAAAMTAAPPADQATDAPAATDTPEPTDAPAATDTPSN